MKDPINDSHWARTHMMTVHLKDDEVKKIKEILESQDTDGSRHDPNYRQWNCHSIVKFALRRLLFPRETRVPVNGYAINSFLFPKIENEKVLTKDHALTPAQAVAKEPCNILDVLMMGKAEEQRKNVEIEAKKAKARAEADEWCKHLYEEVEMKEKENPTPVDARRVHR